LSDDRIEIGTARPAIFPWQAVIVLIVAGYPFAFGTAIYLANWEDWDWYAWVPISLGVLTVSPLMHLGWRRLRSRPARVPGPPSLAISPV
jgi:hypothetical protein